MITLCCPSCGKKFKDKKGENALRDEAGRIINYDRFYVCPECKTEFDILHGNRILKKK